jgi:hypothetical protein
MGNEFENFSDRAIIRICIAKNVNETNENITADLRGINPFL